MIAMNVVTKETESSTSINMIDARQVPIIYQGRRTLCQKKKITRKKMKMKMKLNNTLN